MSDPLVIVVTGCSRGIGRGIINVLAQQDTGHPLTIYATSRSGIDTAINVIPQNKVRYSTLDITNRLSIDTFFRSVLEEHSAIDVLINNAAVSNNHRETPEYAEQTVHTNYGGTRDMCQAFLSQRNIRPGARIVNMSSGFNALSAYGKQVQEKFRSASSIAELDAIMKNYLNDMNVGPEAQEQGGWGTGARSYQVSKALINALTVILAQEYSDVLVNSCCPGWVNTDMGKQGKGTPPKTPEEGARTAVRLAIGDLGPGGDQDGSLGKASENVAGKFFENENILVPGWGSSKLWMET